MQIDMPKKVESIIETLSSHGYEAYAVGGVCAGYDSWENSG